ncbi:methylaspartate mutase subunit E [Erysipelotrichaceae bacterium OttesenSCG-928-M19]|nr:methylaspartate mutase subunit E [Erysipelotrichaceae bacterium OttesenSCG-928-M19]
MKVQNKKWTDEQFFAVREEVLATWPTGEAIRDLDANIAYAKSIPAHKNFAEVLEKADKNKKTLAQPRAGVATIDQHVELLTYLQDVGGADLLPSTIDSYTRQNRYENCQSGIEESLQEGRSLLNGFPAVNHGVEGCRKVLENVNRPLQARHGTPDARLLSEIIHAAGWTSNEGGAISYNIPYSKNVPLEKTIVDWQYCDRLAAIYEENGVKINREPFGPLTGTLVPPSMSGAVAIIEALLAAEQGVKSITVGYGQCGNRIQDVASIRVLKALTKQYLEEKGYENCVVTTVLHQWMGGFPADEAEAYAVISNASATAAFAHATKVIVKTTHEAIGIPTKEANANGIKNTKMTIQLLENQTVSKQKVLTKEMDLIEAEIRCIMDAVYQAGDGDLAVGVIEAIKAGIIDIPFAPSVFNAGKMLPARDNHGCVRYLDFGNIPFTDDIKKANVEKLEERAKVEGREIGFEMTVDDIYAVGQGHLIGRPENWKEGNE